MRLWRRIQHAAQYLVGRGPLGFISSHGEKLLSLERNPLAVNEQYLALLGSATVSWSVLDLQVQIVIWRLLDIGKDDGRAITNHMFFNNRIHLAKTLLNLAMSRGDIKKQIHDFLQEDIESASSLSEDRNHIMHGLFTIDDDGSAQIVRITARGTIKRQVRFKTTEEIGHFINAVNCTSDNLWWLIDIEDWMKTDPAQIRRGTPP